MYGQGRNEKLLGQALRLHPGSQVIVATKIPPQNMRWPALAGYRINETYPPDPIRELREGMDLPEPARWDRVPGLSP